MKIPVEILLSLAMLFAIFSGIAITLVMAYQHQATCERSGGASTGGDRGHADGEYETADFPQLGVGRLTLSARAQLFGTAGFITTGLVWLGTWVVGLLGGTRRRLGLGLGLWGAAGVMFLASMWLSDRLP